MFHNTERRFVQDDSGDLVPEGVELFDPDDYSTSRNQLYDSVAEAFMGSFPRTYGKVRMELDGVEYADPPEVSPVEEKKAKLEGLSLTRRLRGNLRLVDVETEEELDRKTVTLAKVPILTQRGTVISKGSDYTSIKQLRLMPGAYHMRRSSGDIAAQFNVKRGTGPGFNISLEPSTGIYRMEIKGSKIPLYHIMRNLGYSDEDLEEAWGKDLLETNRQKASGRDWPKAFSKIVGPRGSGVTELKDQIDMVREVFDKMTFNREALAQTLPSLVEKG